MTDDAHLEAPWIGRAPPDPSLCPWCGAEWASDADGLPTCCDDAREYPWKEDER